MSTLGAGSEESEIGGQPVRDRLHKQDPWLGMRRLQYQYQHQYQLSGSRTEQPFEVPRIEYIPTSATVPALFSPKAYLASTLAPVKVAVRRASLAEVQHVDGLLHALTQDELLGKRLRSTALEP